ncbi:hypothetical protein [Anatilimnocola floriformis]|uniref:hypothetical protein n=1 Tax=Anatilimnocola floriformis TaxID=2948575 RepID=UPI0020C4DC5A|nr:hypothetical protein [Anatilimnocola floriformis]
MNTPSVSETWLPRERRDWLWQQGRERKWQLFVGVLLAVVLILAVQRWSRPAYVTPLQRYPLRATVPLRSDVPLRTDIPPRTSDPLLNGRTLNYPATAIGNFPVYPVGPGGQVMPFFNRSTRDQVVKEAYFVEKNAGRPLINGVGVAAYEIRFEPKDYDAGAHRWGRLVSDLTFPANTESRVVVRVVDPVRAGQRMYGALLLRLADGELVQFEASQVIVQAD